jgi:hypothetical protein
MGTTKEINSDNGKLPSLSLSEITLKRLSQILIDGGADSPSFENGQSDKISSRLRSGRDGFFDKTKFPDGASV